MPARDDKTFTTSLLHAAADPYRLFVESVRNYAIYMLNPAGRIVSWNTAAERIKGFTAEDVLGQPFDMMFAPEAVVAGKPQRDLETALRLGSYEDEGLRSRKDGSSFLGIYAITPLYESGLHIGFAVIVRDVTHKRQQEERLRRSERRFRSLIEATAMIVWSAAPDGSVATDMTGWGDSSGMAAKETSGWGWLEAVHPDDRAGAAERWQAAVDAQQPYRSEYRMQREDGQWRFIVARAAPIRDEQGAVVEWVGVCEDVTESKDAQQELMENERRYRALVENSWDGVLLVDEQRRFVDITPAGERILGYAKSELVGKSALEIVFPGELEASREKFAEVMNNPRVPFRFQREMQHRDGSSRWLEISATSLLDEPSVRAIVANFRDITQQKLLEQQFLQAQKMEAVGRLAAGVAHDFNNLLTVINSYSEILLGEAALATPLREFVVEIDSAGKRAETLTRQLLTLSRQQVRQESVLDLNEVVAHAEAMIGRLIGEDVQMEIVLAPDLAAVKADAGQLEQVLLNLVVNARDAMPHGGRLRIETANVRRDDSNCDLPADGPSGDCVSLAVTDTGVGMDEATQAHVFEPFYTTKKVGQGTGLGLATVHSIVTQSGGQVDFQSQAGVGTTFTVCLPQVESQQEKPSAVEPPGEPLRGDETVLLVEDEGHVRLLVRRILASSGYSVLEASDGQAAIKILEETTRPVDLVISDVIMPQMGGRQLAEQIAKLRPACKVLLASGYTDDDLLRYGVESRELEFIRKPFTPAKLLTKIRALLDQEDAPGQSGDGTNRE
ncbi:MAG: hybrid sensor histidine kinase/response regulator [Planctomycetaceae bacterium]|nr:hybrid sensor histidine kinase/response regulator [Planctomycetaceae bacterium]